MAHCTAAFPSIDLSAAGDFMEADSILYTETLQAVYPAIPDAVCDNIKI